MLKREIESFVRNNHDFVIVCNYNMKFNGPAYELRVLTRPFKTRPGLYHTRRICIAASKDKVIAKATKILGDRLYRCRIRRYGVKDGDNQLWFDYEHEANLKSVDLGKPYEVEENYVRLDDV